MPLYEIFCECGARKEIFLKLNETEPVCDKCGLRMKKAVSAPVFHLKGTCWARDNYSRTKESKGDSK